MAAKRIGSIPQKPFSCRYTERSTAANRVKSARRNVDNTPVAAILAPLVTFTRPFAAEAALAVMVALVALIRAEARRPIPMVQATGPVMVGGRITSSAFLPPATLISKPTMTLSAPVARKPAWTTDRIWGSAGTPKVGG